MWDRRGHADAGRWNYGLRSDPEELSHWIVGE
jgi:hypothetical protein